MNIFLKIPIFTLSTLSIAIASDADSDSDSESTDTIPLQRPVLRRTIGSHKYIHDLHEFMEAHELNDLENAEAYASTLHYFFSYGVKHPNLEDVESHMALAKKPDAQTELFESILKRESAEQH